MSRPETDLPIDHGVIDVQNPERCSSEKPEATFSRNALALAADTPIPRDTEGPIFAEPWQAQAFALVVELQNKGVFTADEWAQALSAEIREALAAGGCRDGSDYYERWCEALEHLLIAKGLASHDGVDALAASWARAAEATPHGKPILLENDPLRPIEAAPLDRLSSP